MFSTVLLNSTGLNHLVALQLRKLETMTSNQRFFSLLDHTGQWVVLDFAAGVIVRLPESLRHVPERPVILHE
eukprot:6478762-Amphidinium_carterae.1